MIVYTLTDDIYQDIHNLYLKYHKQKTYEHVVNVSKVSVDLAKQFHLDETKCKMAALLHDVSAIMTPQDMYLEILSRHLSIDHAEQKYPFLLHQRVSKIIAEEIFLIHDKDILSAIECHTTLKKDANLYDKVIYIADKIAWDQDGEPPYLLEVIESLKISLDRACYVFMKYQFDNQLLLMPHTWLKEAFSDLKMKGMIDDE